MTFFETVKNAVTVKQAAEHYGCKVNRGDTEEGMLRFTVALWKGW